MPLGLRILIIVMSVLVAGSVIGFASYGIYAAVNRGYGVTTLPGDPLIPNFPHENDGPAKTKRPMRTTASPRRTSPSPRIRRASP